MNLVARFGPNRISMTQAVANAPGSMKATDSLPAFAGLQIQEIVLEEH